MRLSGGSVEPSERAAVLAAMTRLADIPDEVLAASHLARLKECGCDLHDDSGPDCGV